MRTADLVSSNRCLVALALLGLTAGCAPRTLTAPATTAASPAPPTAATAEQLPTAADWRRHLADDILPFWTHPAALGDPVGAFPTFRCNDGRAWDRNAPCPELAEAPDWIHAALGRDYTRMRSRQTYVYGVGFHLTGDPRLLALARAGAHRIAASIDADGSVPSWFVDGRAEPPPEERTTQDLAYAQLGMAMTWYLTREPELLDALLRVEEHIFGRYWRPDWGMLAWTRGGEEAGKQELVAQLDQVNAYLLLVAPLLPEPHRSRWLGHLRTLADVLVERYWDEELGMFWGRLDDPAERRLGGRHLDFGHSIKALWMLERTALLLDDATLRQWAHERAGRLLARALVDETGCWADGPRPEGGVHPGLTWWSFAELDQAAATLALADRDQAAPLPRTAACWRRHLVDREHGGVWAWAHPTDVTAHAGKAHLWKNGYHEAEHALVMALTTAALAGEPIELYFALPASVTPTATPATAWAPYVFGGEPSAREAIGPAPELPGHQLERVSFTALR